MKDAMVRHTDVPTKLESPVFKDGQIVQAADLYAAFRYPVEMMRTLVRAYFGCGVVCGLEPCPQDENEDRWTITIHPGFAVDCAGYPIEVCKPIEIDLRPDFCEPDPPKCLLVAIRRVLDDCSGEDGAKSGRQKESARIGVFKSLKCVDLCEPHMPKEPNPCECLTRCDTCGCDGDSWIPLAVVHFGKDTVLVSDVRVFVRPVRCICPPERRAVLEVWQRDPAG